ncbi:MAG TPA: hypothetical protein PLZ84_01990, partial [Clostridia bacterium]|nr:hypothetical protein [Clostridia bacterium]
MGVFIFRKMLKNKWLVLFLTVSVLLTVTMVASIPLYSNGIMQRVLISELDSYEYENLNENYVPSSLESAKEYNDPFNKVNREVSRYAGNFIIDVDFKLIPSNERQNVYNIFTDQIENQYLKNINLPIISQTIKLKSTDYYMEVPKNKAKKFIYFRSMTHWEDHIDIIDGRMPEVRNDGVIECMVIQSGLKNLGVYVGDEYKVADSRRVKTYTVKVVGTFYPKTESATIFTDRGSDYAASLFIDPDLMVETFLTPYESRDINLITGQYNDRYNIVSSAQWYYVLDYNKMDIFSLKRVYDTTGEMRGYFSKYSNISFNIPMIMVLDGFFEKQSALNRTLLVIELPILI